MTISPAVKVSSSSGHLSLEMAREAGMDMTQEEMRAIGEIPMEI